MSRLKNKMNDVCRKRTDLHIITNEEIRKVHAVYLKMGMDIFNMCQKNNLIAILAGGSLLGAIRHDGFIPWDDDLDIYMPRADYEKFMEIFESEFKGKYKLTAPNYGNGIARGFAKVENKYPILEDTRGRKHGLAVDIFPMENAPDNFLIRKFYGLRSHFYLAVAAQVKYYESTDSTYAREMFGKSKDKYIYYIKMFTGWMFHFRKARKWYKIADRKNQYQDDNTLYVSVPTGRGHYFGELYHRDGMTNTVLHKFETEMFPIPIGWEEHLIASYGDYMKIPPVNKREQHWIKSIEFEEDAVLLQDSSGSALEYDEEIK